VFPNPGSSDVLLDVQNLRVGFEGGNGSFVAVDDVSLSVPKGKTVALVGESGCGKSVTALSILRLIPQPPARILDGRILLASDGFHAHENAHARHIDLLTLPARRMTSIRGGRIAMVFQDPMSSLHPFFTVGEQIAEAVRRHQRLKKKQAWREAVEALGRVGISSPQMRARDYPHQLSGGMRQRVMIAMALACRPALLIADEPTTALDVTVQAQIIDLLRSLQQETAMSILLITHDLGVVAELADDVYVMYAGRIVEHAPVSRLFHSPLHPYTQGLLTSRPRLDSSASRLSAIPGMIPSLQRLPGGCRFHPRCSLTVRHATHPDRATLDRSTYVGQNLLRRCVETFPEEPSGEPVLREFAPGHEAACWEAEASRTFGNGQLPGVTVVEPTPTL